LKTKKLTISKLQKLLWLECKRIVRARYDHTCYTCGKSGLVGSDLQTGHMIAKAALGAYLKYDLRLLRPQCTNCNIWHGGMGAVFIENMRMREGDEYVDGILADRNVSVRAYDHYLRLLFEYRELEK
jgi:hypothetical protein